MLTISYKNNNNNNSNNNTIIMSPISIRSLQHLQHLQYMDEGSGGEINTDAMVSTSVLPEVSTVASSQHQQHIAEMRMTAAAATDNTTWPSNNLSSQTVPPTMKFLYQPPASQYNSNSTWLLSTTADTFNPTTGIALQSYHQPSVVINNPSLLPKQNTEEIAAVSIQLPSSESISLLGNFPNNDNTNKLLNNSLNDREISMSLQGSDSDGNLTHTYSSYLIDTMAPLADYTDNETSNANPNSELISQIIDDKHTAKGNLTEVLALDSIKQKKDYNYNYRYNYNHNHNHNRNLHSENSNTGNSFMLFFDDFGEYIYNYNDSTVAGTTNNFTISSTSTNFDYRTNCTNINLHNLTNLSSTTFCYETSAEVSKNYWALILIVFPVLTLFGNILVILSVFRERSLQTVTNYFIVSLAIADLLVAVVVMPFAVYALVNVTWGLPYFACDFYIAMDVICSTSSIFNLVAISVDRYIAVTQPIKYAKHRNSRRVCLTIVLVWAISAAIGSPIVLGLNNTPDRDPTLCMFYNTDFIVYSSLSSFYIPCIIMVFLYWNIFKALRSRARKQRAQRKPHISELVGSSVIENVAQTKKLAETIIDSGCQSARIMTDEPPTNTGSGSIEEEEENATSPDIDDCHIIINDKSTEFMLATVVEETGNVVTHITTQSQLMVRDSNGNHDSGYSPSNVDDVLAGIMENSSPPDSPTVSGVLQQSGVSSTQITNTEISTKEPTLSTGLRTLACARHGIQIAKTLSRNDSTISTTSKTSIGRKEKRNTPSSRFTIYKVQNASKKKREKSSAKKERKATKTLAIVLGVFLFCWLPFFSCNIMDAMCAKFDKDCSPGVTAFIFTTWLGYINSFVNPVIYTIFNPEFRKAFKKIMCLG